MNFNFSWRTFLSHCQYNSFGNIYVNIKQEYFFKEVTRLSRGSCQGRDLSEEDNKLEKNPQRKWCDGKTKQTGIIRE